MSWILNPGFNVALSWVSAHLGQYNIYLEYGEAWSLWGDFLILVREVCEVTCIRINAFKERYTNFAILKIAFWGLFI